MLTSQRRRMCCRIHHLSVLLLVAASGCGNARHFEGMRLHDEAAGRFVMVPPIAQDRTMLCGASACAAVLAYHAVPVSQVMAQIDESEADRAWSASEIVAVARDVGLEAYFYKGSLEDALSNVKQGRPVIVLLRGPPRTGRYPSLEWFRETVHMLVAEAHWVVLVGWSGAEDVVLLDPAHGYLVMRRCELQEEWQRAHNACVLISPKREESPAGCRG